MNDQLHVVNLETCNGDGICAEVCPENALELLNEKAATVESRAGSCIYCGQCVAVCPTESLQMPKLEMEDFRRLQKRPFGYDEFHEFLRLRRSVRVFKDQPIERHVIEKVLEAAATAPMGFPPHTTEVVVIDDRAELDFLLEELVREYDSMIKAFSSPIGRAMVRLSAGAEDYRVLKNHVLENVQLANELFHSNGTDRYMYRAPVLMMFHGSRWGISYEENAHLRLPPRHAGGGLPRSWNHDHRFDLTRCRSLKRPARALRHSQGQSGADLAHPRPSEVQVPAGDPQETRRRDVPLSGARESSQRRGGVNPGRETFSRARP